MLGDADALVLEAQRRTTSAVDEQAAVRKAVEDGKATVMRCVTEHARLEAAQAAAERQRGQLAERAAAVEARSAEAGESLQHLEAALEIARTRQTTTQAALAAARAELENAKQRVQDAKDHGRRLALDLKAAEKARDELARGEAEARARVEAHRQMLVDHVGVPDGLRDALAVEGTLGTFAENLEVPIEIEEHVAALLGELAQAVLVPDENVALRVRERATGRVAVIVVDGMDVPSTGLLAQIRGTEWGRKALRQLFGVLPEAADVGAAIVRARTEDVAVRSLCGAAADPNGVVRWGKPGGEGASLLGRRRELAALEAALVEATARRADGEARVGAAEEGLRAVAAEVETAEAELEARRTEMNEKELADRDATHGVTTRARELEGRRARADEIERDRLDVRSKSAALEAELSELQAKATATLVEQAEAEDRLKGHQSQLFTTEERTQRERAELTRLATEVGGLRRRLGELVDSEDMARAACDGARGRMTSAMEESQTARERVAFLRQDDQRLAQLLEELTTNQAALRERIENERVRLKSDRERLGEIERRLKEVWQVREQATALRTQLEARLEDAKAEIQRIRDGLEERYQLSVTALLDRVEQAGHVVVEADRQHDVAVRDADAPPSGDDVAVESVPIAADLTITVAMLEDAQVVADWSERVKAAKARLDRLGDVNLVAAHEYKEVAERFTTLDAQRVDLEGSVRTIRETIAKLNKTCRERFRETFDRVNSVFEEIYPKLVGGGQARLVLTNEDDLLETGVDIFVQPPGKRMQNLSLLSGGEMAMTSIALIFALFRVKPSPFCLLDEVDAPLDEGNGARFNAMLKDMASLSQFIVVTHNKKTMECMDTLYGVTMNNPGISSVVSVQLE
jgi:chromosome segregation protein